MSHQIVLQPDGLLAIFDNDRNVWQAWDSTEDQVVDTLVEIEGERRRENAANRAALVDSGLPDPEFPTLTFEQAQGLHAKSGAEPVAFEDAGEATDESTDKAPVTTVFDGDGRPVKTPYAAALERLIVAETERMLMRVNELARRHRADDDTTRSLIGHYAGGDLADCWDEFVTGRDW